MDDEIDHRLDGEEHAFAQRNAFARPAEMQHVGGVVEDPAETMTAEIANHRTALGLGIGLDGVADIAQGGAGLDHGDAAHHGLVGDLDQAPRLERDIADEKHAARIAVPAVDDGGDVDIEDIAVPQPLVAGNAVADHMVDRGADRFGKTAVVERRRDRAAIADEPGAELVERLRGDPGNDMRGDEIEGLRGQAAGHAHRLVILLAMDQNAFLRAAFAGCHDLNMSLV